MTIRQASEPIVLSARALEESGFLSGRRKVVLFYPPYDGPPLGATLSLLCLAAPLLQSGFEVKLVDHLTSPDHCRPANALSEVGK
jgi:hypothetical protein